VIPLGERNKADVAAIEERLKQYSDTVNAGDFEGWMSIWADSGIQMPPGTPARIGKEKIRTEMKPAFDYFTLKMTMKNEEIRVSGNLAFARGTYVQSLTPKTGGKTQNLEGKYLSIYEKQPDGSWKGIRDCFNSNRAET
jgi:uncharacterized protein (TIGR02246 family)